MPCSVGTGESEHTRKRYIQLDEDEARAPYVLHFKLEFKFSRVVLSFRWKVTSF